MSSKIFIVSGFIQRPCRPFILVGTGSGGGTQPLWANQLCYSRYMHIHVTKLLSMYFNTSGDIFGI